MNFKESKFESRIEWADIFKGITIILVVLGHATGKFNIWIYQFHMAAFFFISGYLSNVMKKSDISVAVKKFFTILLPYFSLGLVGILLNAAFDKMGLHEFLFGNEYVGAGIAIKEMFLKGNVYVQYLGTFWFLIALFGVEILHIVLCQVNGKKINFVYFIISMGLYFVGYACVKNGLTKRIWIIDIDTVLIAQFYYTIGLFLHQINTEHNLMNNKKVAYSVCAIVAVTISVWGCKNGIVVDLASRSINSPSVDFVVAMASIYITFLISLILSNYSRYIKALCVFCGKNSLGIMVFHFALFKFFFVLLYKLGKVEARDIVNVVPTEEFSEQYWIILTIFAIIGSLFLWWAIMKIPFLKRCSGKDTEFNRNVCLKISGNTIVIECGRIWTNFISHLWEMIMDFIHKNKLFCICSGLCIILVAIPLYRIEIIENGVLQARYNAINGSFSDGWLEKESLFLVTTGDKGKIHLSLYYPGINFDEKLVRMFINGDVVEEVMLDDTYTYVDLDTQPNETLELSIECSFEYENKGEDIRELAIILSELDVE